MPILSPKKPLFPIGLSDYPTLRRRGYTYVDKTKFVADILDGGAIVTMFPRPRRFGKTLNLSTLRAFLDRGQADNTDIFADTFVWNVDGGRLREHFQRYPVVYLTFKEVKATTWADAWTQIREHVVGEVERLVLAFGLQDRAASLAGFTRRYSRWLDPDVSPAELGVALSHLSGWLETVTGEPAVILIDEYDAPLHAAWEHGFWKEAVSFFRAFLSGGLKDNTSLYRGVLTGILKVAKENIFSGLNNIETWSILSPYGATDFGFTDDEVDALTALADVSRLRDEIREWYDGYRFGGPHPETLYNPWSILSFLGKPDRGLQSFWKNTSSNALIHRLLLRNAGTVGPGIATLLDGGTITTELDENVVLQDLDRSPSILWALLTFSGYLTPTEVTRDDGDLRATLRIPNRETRSVFQDGFVRLLDGAPADHSVPRLAAALLHGDAITAEDVLQGLLLHAMSHHDFVGSRVEAVYQAFLVGLLIRLDPTHRVTSNREAGYGRADVLITPRTPGPGAVLELKSVGTRETPQTALQSAVDQLNDRRYDREVLASGATEVFQYAVVFDGKRCQVQIVG